MVDDLSPRQLALAGEFVKEGYAMNDAIQMAREAGDPTPGEAGSLSFPFPEPQP